MTHTRTLIVTAGVLYGLLAVPPVTGALESSMVGHMLVQLPLLALAGGLAARGLAGSEGTDAGGFNAGGITGLVLATLVAAVWMLPRSLDGALTSATIEAAKFVTVPLLVGTPIALSWPRAGSLVRGLVWAHVIAMQLTLGWLYLAAPVRLCLGYRLDQQSLLGAVLLGTGAAVAFFLAIRAFMGPTAKEAGSGGSEVSRATRVAGALGRSEFRVDHGHGRIVPHIALARAGEAPIEQREIRDLLDTEKLPTLCP
jgi:hypothetical protein